MDRGVVAVVRDGCGWPLPRREVHFALENDGWSWAVSGGGCTVDDGVQYFGGGLSVQDFSWAALELVLDGLDLGVGDVGEAGALGEVLADQPACVLVGGTLSGGCGDRRSRPGYR